MLEEFIQTFGLPGGTLFKMREIEDAILLKFGDIQYFYEKGWKEVDDYGNEINHPNWYSCGTQFEWESNKISTNYLKQHLYTTRERALMGLLLDNKRKFKTLVRKVYGLD